MTELPVSRLAPGDIVEVPHLGKREVEKVTLGHDVCLELKDNILPYCFPPSTIVEVYGRIEA